MRIDTSKIAGYADMTPEQKLAAVEALDFEPGSEYISKKTFDKTASELAEAKRRLKEKMSDDEAAEQERNQRYTDLEAKYNELMKSSTIAGYKAKLVAQGYDDALAGETAAAMFDNDTTKVFENQQKFLTAYEKRIKQDALQSMERPGGDSGADAEDDAVKMARSMAKQQSAQNKSYEDIMSQYN